MTATELIRTYLEAVTPGRTQFDRVRQLLTDDFTMSDPLMSADSADHFVAQLRAFGEGPPMRTRIEEVVGHGNTVAALTRVELGEHSIEFSQWFRIRDDKIQHLRVIYDPRPFLRMASAQPEHDAT